jgi:hypothetical protein
VTITASPRRNPIRGLVGVLVEELGAQIVSGRLPVDEPLGSHRVRAHFEVSNTVAREALRILQGKGLVRTRPNTGTRVNPISEWHLFDPDVLRWFRLAGQPFRDDQAALLVGLQALGDLEPGLKDNLYFERLITLFSGPKPQRAMRPLHVHAWPLPESEDTLAKPEACACGMSYNEGLKLGFVGPGE